MDATALTHTTERPGMKQENWQPCNHVQQGNKPMAGASQDLSKPPKSVSAAAFDPPIPQQVSFRAVVVKVFCTHTSPNFSMPWQREPQAHSTSSGFVARFDGQRCLLTNAHSVRNHTQVKVRKSGDDHKYLAKVLSNGLDCDIALLDVEDERFWEGMELVELGPLPQVQDSVRVIGYPLGGDTISVTAGVVSRLEVINYRNSETPCHLLAVQIDAAINSGNSGGPVFDASNKLCGIAFMALCGATNAGFIIPTPIICHFLHGYQRTGRFTGFPSLGITTHRLESDALRQSLSMAPHQKGVLVRRMHPHCEAAAVLRRNDVLMAFEGVPIASDGPIPFRSEERISYSYLVSTKYVGDMCKLKVLRDGRELDLEIRLSCPHALVPPYISSRDPGYFIVGGLVFTVLTYPYYQSEFDGLFSSPPIGFQAHLHHGTPREPDEEVVLLSQVLVCDATIGYENNYNLQVFHFNGTPLRNLKHLAELVSTCKDKYMSFEMENDTLMVLETAQACLCHGEIMAQHSIPHLMSKELRDAGVVWPPKRLLKD